MSHRGRDRMVDGTRISSGAHLKKLRRADGGAKNVGVFRVKKYDFTPKNHILSNCGGRREKFWGISCEKSRFTPKNHTAPLGTTYAISAYHP